MLISFALGSRRKRSFQWNMGFRRENLLNFSPNPSRSGVGNSSQLGIATSCWRPTPTLVPDSLPFRPLTTLKTALPSYLGSLILLTTLSPAAHHCFLSQNRVRYLADRSDRPYPPLYRPISYSLCASKKEG